MKKQRIVPVVACYWVPPTEKNHPGEYAVWCPFCSEWHTHGAAAAGHRAPHCIEESSPFKETGYELKCIGLLPKHLMTKTGSLKNISKLKIEAEHIR
ncbi:MAG: hypothetical protein AB1490_27275 [Pseudomonadota bacterium]